MTQRINEYLPRIHRASVSGVLSLLVGFGCGDEAKSPKFASGALPDRLCDPSTKNLKIFGGRESSTYLGLSERQQRAIGLVSLEGVEGDSLGCTGTMIAPGWVLTAAHCAPPGDRALYFTAFGESMSCVGSWRSRRILQHATLDLLLIELQGSPSEFCKFFPPLALSDGTWLEAGTLVELAGLGLTDDGTHGGRRFVAELVVKGAHDESEIVVDGLGRTGACVGDSGGPLIFRVSDGKARVAGVLSAGSSDCTGQDRYVRLDPADAFFAPVPKDEQCPSLECGSIDEVGRCFGNQAVWCDNQSEVHGEECGANEVCGWHAKAAGFRCVSPESPCAGVDRHGRCSMNVSEHCEDGSLTSDDCTAAGGSCILDASGAPRCETP